MQPFSIVPAPKLARRTSGEFSFTQDTQVAFRNEAVGNLSVIPALEVMGAGDAGHILQPSGIRLVKDVVDTWLKPLRERSRCNLVLGEEQSDRCIVLVHNGSLEGLESYELEVTENRVKISATSAVGLLFGLQSVLQLTKPAEVVVASAGIEASAGAGTLSGTRATPQATTLATIPCCHIEDTPRFAWRGLHLDCGRFFQPLEGVKRFIDTMVLHKFNIFHWHLTEDQGWRLEVKKYPKLTTVGSKRKATCWGHLERSGKKLDDGVPHEGFYTQDEVREIVGYARDRGIMVVPEIDLPGHSRAAIAAYPELGIFGKEMDVQTKWGVCSDIYNPEEKTVAFLEDVMREVLQLFPSPWIHVGGDEAAKDQWKASDRVAELIKERGLKDVHEMQSWFISKISAFLQGQGRQVIGWDEIMDGGTPAGATVMAWRHEKMGIQAAKQGHQVLMCPCQRTYLDYREERGLFEMVGISTGYKIFQIYPLKRFYAWNPLPKGLSAQEAELVMGGQGQVWTEYMPVPKAVDFMTWPRASALAERLWSPAECQNFDDFFARLGTMLQLLDYQEVEYCMQKPLKAEGEFTVPGAIDAGTQEVAGASPQPEAPLQDSSASVALSGVQPATQPQEYTVDLGNLADFPAEFRRIQIQFARKGRRGYGLIQKVRLETSDGHSWEDITQGYVGKFNRLNVYTFGNGTVMQSQGARLIFTLQSCSEVPAKSEYPIADCRIAWAWRAR